MRANAVRMAGIVTGVVASESHEFASVSPRAARCCSWAAGARRSFTKSSGSSCSSSSSGRRRSRWACCSARSWAGCAWAACCCRVMSARAASAARLRVPRTRHRRRSGCWCCSACRSRRRLHGVGRLAGSSASSCAALVAAHLPAAADAADGRDAAGDRAVGRDRRREGVSWLGFFYGGNIAGAVIGSLLAGFYLLRVYDVVGRPYVAVAINVIVAALGFADREGRRRTTPSNRAAVTQLRAAPGALDGFTWRSRCRA